ncbi:MAG TPA: D-alanyl-D-alanine carboxypeptidase family protein [Mobilitalea sp.]|nr:D-alanyl-D-alanine carboxypeptidase family protein [Mobilitalea sp.]
MKRQLVAFTSIFIILFSLLLNSVPVQATATDSANQASWPDGPSVFADAAIVMEASTGLVLYEKNMNHTYYPASITKIMTALLAIENSSLGDIVTFSRNAVYDVDLDSSRIGIDVGEQLTMQQCLYALLLESDNTSAYAIAEHVSGSIPAFAKLMNERAKSIGCKNTNFVNPHGLPEDNHYTSAYDMALITREAMKNETFRKIFASRTYQIPPTNLQPETRYLRNHHKFVLKQDYLYDDCIGGKTGYTTVAKYTLVSVAKHGNLELICVIMHDDSNEHQYTDTQKLFDYGFNNFSIYKIADLETTQALTESPMFTKYNALLSDSNSPIITDKDGYLVLPNTASFKDAKKDVTFYSSDKTSSSKTNGTGDNVIGRISYTYQGKYVGGADILYNNEEKLALIQNAYVKNNPTASPDKSAASPSKSGGSLRPIIVGCIIGLFVIAIGLYYALVERPRLKRRNAYYKKRAKRKLYQDDDYLDL